MFIVSDLHAVSKPLDAAESYARTWTESHATHNALTAAKEYIAREGLRADVLLCPGDLANLVDAEGMEYAWRTLLEIATLLQADAVVCTAGNHDVVRPAHVPHASYDPNGTLKGLDPPFPTGDGSHQMTFFNEDYVVVLGDRWRVVSLNSCAEHGHDERHLHGSVRDKTLSELKEVLTEEPRAVNILLCHHHPVPWTRYARDDTSHMRAGDRLLELLDSQDAARWILVHGHKHYPALGYVGESTSGPARFSAGSLSVQLYPELRDNKIRNQMYVLEFDLDELSRLPLDGGGRFRSWDWSRNKGMRAAAAESGLPARGGFGYRRDGRDLAAMALDTARHMNRRVVRWDDLVQAEPRWAYVAPLDLAALKRELARNFDGLAHFEVDGTIREISFVRL